MLCVCIKSSLKPLVSYLFPFIEPIVVYCINYVLDLMYLSNVGPVVILLRASDVFFSF